MLPGRPSGTRGDAASGDDDADRTRRGDDDGEVDISVFGTGSEQQPAISVSFDGAGNATVEIVLEPVRIREIDRVPDDRLDTDPNFQGACIRTRTIMVPPDDVGATRRAYEEIVQYSIRAVFPNSDIAIPPACPAPGTPPLTRAT